jgi:hypothetical protein
MPTLVEGEGKTVTLEVPELRDSPAAPVVAQVVDLHEGATNASATAHDEPTRQVATAAARSQITAGVVLVGAGLVGIGVGTGFGLSAKSAWNRALELCDANNVCDSSDAKRAGTISTISFSVGAVGLVTGALLILAAPSAAPAKRASSGSARWWIAPDAIGRGGLAAGGAF